MKEQVKISRYTCDGCQKVVDVEGDALPDGFTGTVIEIAPMSAQRPIRGSGMVDWFACRSSCIKNAVTTALARAR